MGYDGSGYTVQMKWIKSGDLWKITQMVEINNGHGHVGIPRSSATPNAGATSPWSQYIDGVRDVSGRRTLSSADRRRLTAEKKASEASRRKTQQWTASRPVNGNLDPTITRVPSPVSDAESAQMLWDRQDILEHVSMYSWLADETRQNYPLGFAWGDMWANDGTFCIYGANDAFAAPPYDMYAEGNIFPATGHGFIGGYNCNNLGVPANQTCRSTCTANQGAWTPVIQQLMINATFGFSSALQRHNQQSRHTLTNKMIIEQTLTTAIAQYSNSLERFFDGIAYDGSFFVYQLELVKQGDIWKYQKISVIAQGNGPFGGNLAPTTWNSFQNGMAPGYGAATTATTAGGTQSTPPLDQPGVRVGGTTQYPYGNPKAANVVAPNIQLNPLVSRIPYAAVACPVQALCSSPPRARDHAPLGCMPWLWLPPLGPDARRTRGTCVRPK